MSLVPAPEGSSSTVPSEAEIGVPVDAHRIDENDAALGNDVEIYGFIAGNGAALVTGACMLPTADTKIQPIVQRLPVLAIGEPAFFRLFIGLRRRGIILTLDRQFRVFNGSAGHLALPFIVLTSATS